MNWTAAEIVEAYQKDPSKANMVRIARENNCTLEEIGNFLKNAAVKRKPGRPKKSGSETTKKDENEKTPIKSDSIPVEKPAQKYLILRLL